MTTGNDETLETPPSAVLDETSVSGPAVDGEPTPDPTPNPTTRPADTAESTSAVTAGNASDVSGDAHPDVSVKHRFRLIHQQHYGDNATAAHTFTTAEHDTDEFIQWAKDHKAEFAPLIRLLIQFL